MSFTEVRTVIYHRPRFRAWGPSFKAGDFASSTLTRTHESTSSGLLESLHYRYTAATSNGQGIRVSQAGSVHNCTALVLYCRQFPHVESESSVRERWEPRPGAALGKARPLRHVQLLSKAREATGSCARNWISCSIRLVHNCTALVMYLMHNTPSHMKIEINGSPRKTRQSKSNVDPYVTDLLENIVEGKTILQLGKDVKVFSQGDSAEAIYFIQNGKVKVTVVSAMGNEAVLAILGPRGFLGEGCLVGQTLRVSTATAIQPTTIFRIERRAMLRALHAQSELTEKFTASLLARNIDLQEDLCDQLFNHSEKRLARVLLKLARFGQNNAMPVAKMPRLSHETLAEMVGTTRSRITHFMNKFRKLGLIDYNGEITVRAELLTDVVLHD